MLPYLCWAARSADCLTTSYYAIKEFCVSHDLKINPEKTQLIILKKPTKPIPEDFHLTLDNCIIKPQNTVKLLGVTLDQHLTFGPHIDCISKKCQALLGILARATPHLPKELLKLLYTALIRSHLEYCSSIFSTAAKTHLKKLDIIQRKAARIIYRVPRDAHADLLLLFLNLDVLCDRRETHLIKLIKSFVSGRCHPAMPSFIKLRTDKTLAITQSRSTLGQRRPSVFGATLYNQHLGLSSEFEDTDT